MEQEQQPAASVNQPAQQTQVFIQQQEQKPSNGLGTTGFVLSLLAIFLCWVPVLSWILWILGLIFSFIGVFKRPRGLAITGLILSLLGLILLIAVVGAVATALASM